ncbi:hypothetical protein Ahy_B10g101595 [Arachis hypogaea]|uniref:Uncharacterized protein n=1 Tax=Arachis hypogaea TaxID=3818 RepID=A0A444WZZ7_ARAHY|nr:hypothetical protein Ahy_B10g101595 [Arachis hypogaea]
MEMEMRRERRRRKGGNGGEEEEDKEEEEEDVKRGASSEIRAETARVLAKRGVRVVIAAKELKKAKDVIENIRKETSNAKVFLLEIDFSSFAFIHRFCFGFLALKLSLSPY